MIKRAILFCFLPSISLATCDVVNALNTLTPGAVWTLYGTNYSGLSWTDQVQTQPTLAQVNQAISDCQTQEQSSLNSLKSDVITIKSSNSTVAQKLQAYQDLLQRKGLLQ